MNDKNKVPFLPLLKRHVRSEPFCVCMFSTCLSEFPVGVQIPSKTCKLHKFKVRSYPHVSNTPDYAVPLPLKYDTVFARGCDSTL